MKRQIKNNLHYFLVGNAYILFMEFLMLTVYLLTIQ